MLHRENRLKKEGDFKLVLRSKNFFSSDFLILKSIKNNLEMSRFAFIVSKKISNKAVIRNRIKRLLREAVRADIKNIKGGWDIIFFTRKNIVEKKYTEIKEEVEKLLRRANIYNEENIIKNN